ncbi:MAG: hypothetical protein OEY14_13685 [Myxococcales bacterium]|nr:hypothetical protein [Myxococcales bacterium]
MRRKRVAALLALGLIPLTLGMISATQGRAEAQAPEGAEGLSAPGASGAWLGARLEAMRREAAARREGASQGGSAAGEREAEGPQAERPVEERLRRFSPRVALGLGWYGLRTWAGGGRVLAWSFEGYLSTGALRLGARAELGRRDYPLGEDGTIVRAAAIGGYQHRMERITPYAGLTAGFGWVLQKLFHTSTSELLLGLGLEVGADLRLVRTLFVGASLGYQRVGVGGLGHDLLELRVRIGL